jgi:DNA mismatch endonuclease (patch repair protein)
MADVFSTRKRSYVMGRIRSSGNKDTELALIRLFRKYHIVGWRRQWKLHGKPDFVFPRNRVAVFVDGCFWHGCLKHSKPPKTNDTYWSQKLLRNKKRDRSVARILRSRGWQVIRIWEHDLARGKERRGLKRILTALG